MLQRANFKINSKLTHLAKSSKLTFRLKRPRISWGLVIDRPACWNRFGDMPGMQNLVRCNINGNTVLGAAWDTFRVNRKLASRLPVRAAQLKLLACIGTLC
jgi:hypothetical protein